MENIYENGQSQSPISPKTTINIDDGPKIGFLDAFYGVLFCPKTLFEDLSDEDVFTIVIYGFLAILLSSLGKISPGETSLLSILGAEFFGIIGWFFVGIFIIILSTIFKTPNSNFGKLLGYTGLSSLPFLLLAPISLISYKFEFIYKIFSLFVFAWSFILFCIAISKSLKLEPWRVFLLGIIPFSLGFASNIIGIIFSAITHY